MEYFNTLITDKHGPWTRQKAGSRWWVLRCFVISDMERPKELSERHWKKKKKKTSSHCCCLSLGLGLTQKNCFKLPLELGVRLEDESERLLWRSEAIVADLLHPLHTEEQQLETVPFVPSAIVASNKCWSRDILLRLFFTRRFFFSTAADTGPRVDWTVWSIHFPFFIDPAYHSWYTFHQNDPLFCSASYLLFEFKK